MKWQPAASAEVVYAAWPADSATLDASVVVTGLSPLNVASVKVTEPVGVSPEDPALVMAAVKVNDWPATTVRISGMLEVRAAPTPATSPKANSVPPFNVYTVPSGPMMVGT